MRPQPFMAPDDGVPRRKDTDVSEHKSPETADTGKGKADAASDVVSDPAQSTEDESSEWTDEGGATPSGPATDTGKD